MSTSPPQHDKEYVVGEEEPRIIYDVTRGLKSEHTKRSYRQGFNNFLKATVKNDDPRILLDTKQSVIESKIIDHITYLKDVQGLSCLSIQLHLCGIFHFFEINDYNLNTKKIKRFLPGEDESDFYAKDRPYSVKEIERILSKCDIRAKVAVLLMASAGMRIDGLRGLVLGDIKKMDEFGLYLIWVYNRSRKERYYTFCTPETAKVIDEYLEYRKSFGEKLKDESPLIRDKFNGDNPFTAQTPKHISTRMLSFIFEDVLKKAGVNTMKSGQKKKKNKRDVMTSHGFRKFFITQCDNAEMNFTDREYLSGHRLPNQDRHYVQKSEEDRLTQYVKAVDLLTIDPNQRLQKRVKELESEKEIEISYLVQELKSAQSRIDELEDDKQTDYLVQELKELRENFEALRSSMSVHHIHRLDDESL